MAAEATPFFVLKPLNDEAVWVVEQPQNRAYWGLNPQTRGNQQQFFRFYLNRHSKTAGRLVSFGRHERNDVRLPSRPPPANAGATIAAAGPEPKRGRSYQNYHNDHCFFFLAPSGELILRDLSPRLVQIRLKGATPEQANLYALHGSPERGLRQRVIPRTEHTIYITIGSSTIFSLRWSDEVVKDSIHVQRYMADRARSMAVSGMTLTVPGSSSSEAPELLHSRELRSRYTPSSASKSGPHKPCHKYETLGSGGFGVVYKAVDLRTGELWAVKEIATSRSNLGQWDTDGAEQVMEKVKESLIQEVDNMAKVSHVSVPKQDADLSIVLPCLAWV